MILWLWPAASGMFLFTLYSMPANSLLPVPHEPGLLYLVQFYDPIWIAVAGCVGTAIAAAIDYPVVKLAFDNPKIRKARNTRIYQLAVRWLHRSPFWTIFVFALTPLPIYVVRVLAPASGYPLWRYMIATVLGRFPRYYIIGWLGHMFHVPGWVLLGMFLALVAAMILGSRTADEIGLDGLEVLEASDTQLPIMTDDLAALVQKAHATDEIELQPAVAVLHAEEKPS